MPRPAHPPTAPRHTGQRSRARRVSLVVSTASPALDPSEEAAMSTQAIVCDSSVIRGMSNDPRNICYHYRHHLTGKQVYHCEISYPEVVEGLMRDLRMSQEGAEAFLPNGKVNSTQSGCRSRRKEKELGLRFKGGSPFSKGLSPLKHLEKAIQISELRGRRLLEEYLN